MDKRFLKDALELSSDPPSSSGYGVIRKLPVERIILKN